MTAVLFSIRSYAALGGEVAEAGGFERGELETDIWPDGEIHQDVKTPVQGRDVHLVAGTGTETDTLEAYDLACTLVQEGARSLSIAIPFFGYSTIEKASRRGQAVVAKSRARLWSSLPIAPLGNRILILEPHTASLTHYFEGLNVVSAVDGRSLMVQMLKSLSGEPPVLCSPDIGRIKWVDGLAASLGRHSAAVLKRRIGDGTFQTFGLAGDVKGRKVVLCDDMIRSGGTLLNAAKACLESGATSVSAVAIHGAFAPWGVAALRESRLFDSLVCTDSHPNSSLSETGWPEVFCCAGVLAEALAKVPSELPELEGEIRR